MSAALCLPPPLWSPRIPFFLTIKSLPAKTAGEKKVISNQDKDNGGMTLTWFVVGTAIYIQVGIVLVTGQRGHPLPARVVAGGGVGGFVILANTFTDGAGTHW
jgi:hypothetical protein